MLSRAPRRIGAFPPRLPLQYRQSTTRSFLTNSRPGAGIKDGRPHVSQTLNRYPQSQNRSLSFAQRMKLGFREASKGIWRKNPILLPFALLSVAGATAFFAYVTYIRLTRIEPVFHKFPPEVADALRTAIYYTEIDMDPQRALDSYKLALRTALAHGMHPYSDEVLGIRLQVALMLEKAGLIKQATQVLERTKAESLKWVDEGRKNKAIADKELAGKTETIEINDPEVLEEQQKQRDLEEYEERQRDKTLKKIVGMGMKLAELYAGDYMQDEKKAEAAQIAAVELCLKEMKRRQDLGLPVGGVNEDNDAWLNLSEIATALTELGTTYINQEKYELSIPLFMQALGMVKQVDGDATTCKQVVLLNNVATAMAGRAQQPIRPSKENPVTREQLIESAKKWAQMAIDVAAKVQPPVRDEDCDVSCVVATYNLGELAELQDKRDLAEKYYQDAKALAKGIGFDDGIDMADTALKRIGKK
ncbi:TPR domain protein [Paecilomyces variotii]|uniref:TPR domain protein n=1 Tax=Byssochlamys spectabilis TaxID=264951 RepID=A0A443HN18_BYSSP|nr:TPR domain protein [Paecilomyces variotii]KAJ9310785.1 hypothetical protein DTO271D3_8960 [Paecilomyces variotii]KAJ9363324.1 hypothetical protein DTO280E4_2732 [Paecilomyces variotii]KAJ9387538.1 hypothetical protein DTO063F5_3102 [Paecilomyces variotii]RWQ93207.1 TPR domain protein [Paecilomyces variotii]